MKENLKTLLAFVGAAVLAWYLLQWLVAAGILHISGVGGY